MIQISDLNDVAHFAETVADRGWHAWWTESGTPLSEYRSGIEKMIGRYDIPTALVAHKDGQYLGSVLLVENDLHTRPQYTPWIAALWVEPQSRRQGVAAELLDSAKNEIRKQGYSDSYLCAADSKTPYYLARGFRLIETDVDGLNIFVR